MSAKRFFRSFVARARDPQVHGLGRVTLDQYSTALYREDGPAHSESAGHERESHEEHEFGLPGDAAAAVRVGVRHEAGALDRVDHQHAQGAAERWSQSIMEICTSDRFAALLHTLASMRNQKPRESCTERTRTHAEGKKRGLVWGGKW